MSVPPEGASACRWALATIERAGLAEDERRALLALAMEADAQRRPEVRIATLLKRSGMPPDALADALASLAVASLVHVSERVRLRR